MDTKQERILEKAQERVIETLARNMDLYGITMSTGLLYGTLLFQDKSMTLDEMGEALGMSKTSMSTGVRTLMDLNMVEKIWKKERERIIMKSIWTGTRTSSISSQ